MKIVVRTFAAATLLLNVGQAFASPDEPPFLRTGHDLVESCALKDMDDAYFCSGEYSVLADATEAARWRDKCPPIVEAAPIDSPPATVTRMLEASRDHPDWLSLSAVTFVDKVERLARCHRR